MRRAVTHKRPSLRSAGNSDDGMHFSSAPALPIQLVQANGRQQLRDRQSSPLARSPARAAYQRERCEAVSQRDRQAPQAAEWRYGLGGFGRTGRSPGMTLIIHMTAALYSGVASGEADIQLPA